MLSTMQDAPLLVREILRHGEQVHGRSTVVTFEGDRFRRASFAEVAAACRTAGIRAGRPRSRPGRPGGDVLLQPPGAPRGLPRRPEHGCCPPHLEREALSRAARGTSSTTPATRSSSATLGVAPLLARVLGDCPSVEQVIVVGTGDSSVLGETVGYEEVLASNGEGFDWPDLDERQAAAMCYTSGTTGNPKGVAYSHRSTYLHSLASTTMATLGLSERDRGLVVVPQFHANAWGIPYSSWLAGADLIMPKQFLQAEPLVKIIEAERPTFAGAVPTIWNEVLRYAEAHGSDLSSFSRIICGGSAVPLSLMARFEERFGVPVVQAWGMTETSPLGAVAVPPGDAEGEEMWKYREKAGRVVFGVEVRVVDGTGTVAPRDGTSVGEFEVRGPWVTGSYYGDDGEERFHDGWLRTGDVGTVDERGYMTITDRTKDVIKTGGEWISSVELENALMGHPDVFEAAVVAVPDERWAERPLACIVLADGVEPAPERLTELADYLSGPGRPVVGARAVGLRRRGAEDERREVRQEAAPGRARGRGARRGHLEQPGRDGPVSEERLEELARAADQLGEQLVDAAMDLLRAALDEPGGDAARRHEAGQADRAGAAVDREGLPPPPPGCEGGRGARRGTPHPGEAPAAASNAVNRCRHADPAGSGAPVERRSLLERASERLGDPAEARLVHRLAVGGAGSTRDVLVDEGPPEVVAAGLKKLAGARCAHLDPARLDVVDGAGVGEAPDGVHEEGLAERRPPPRPVLEVDGRRHVDKGERDELGEATRLVLERPCGEHVAGPRSRRLDGAEHDRHVRAEADPVSSSGGPRASARCRSCPGREPHGPRRRGSRPPSPGSVLSPAAFRRPR